jgi:uncharacterized membrane protein
LAPPERFKYFNRMTSRVSPFASAFEPLVSGLWIFYVLVSLLIAAVWTLGWGERSVEAAVSNPDLRATLVWLLAQIDLLWITLAAANVYLCLAASVGLATARKWALFLIGGTIALAWVSSVTGVPLGRIHYGPALGFKVGPVPLGLPLLWFSVVIGAREAILRLLPRASHGGLAAGVGILAFLTDLNLEPSAAKWRAFWFWSAASPAQPPIFDAPLSGSIAWGVLAGLLTLTFRELDVVQASRKRPWQPVVILAICNAVFLASSVAHSLSH